jgi:hydrogenase expression/formation protein HypE
MEKGAIDKFVVNTSGIGRRMEVLDRNIAEVKKHRSFDARWLLDSNLRAGDKIILSGTMGDHGVALLSFREGYDFESTIISDVAPLNKLIMEILEVGGIVSMKDPTRGGLANTLNEWSEKSHVGIMVEEDRIPIREGVRAACEMLGIEALEIGNEGKVVVGVVAQKASNVLAALRKTEQGRDAEIIGEVTDEFTSVVMETSVGGKRIIPPPVGDPIPRIC